MDVAHVVMIVCVLVFTATAAICDIRTKRLPNALTVPAFVAALVFALVSGAVDSGIAGAGNQFLWALAGFGTGFGFLFVLWLIGGGGGGDVKFMGALGAWLGAWLTLQVLLISTVIVACGALFVLAWEFCRLGVSGAQRRYLSPSGRQQALAKAQKEHKDQARQKVAVGRRLMPFGVPVALATWMVLVFTELLPRQ